MFSRPRPRSSRYTSGVMSPRRSHALECRERRGNRDAQLHSEVPRGADGFFALLPEDPFVADFRVSRRLMADAIAIAVRESGVEYVVMLCAVAACVADGNGPSRCRACGSIDAGRSSAGIGQRLSPSSTRASMRESRAPRATVR